MFYPNTALQKLTNLQFLSSDVVSNQMFRPQLLSLKRLYELHLNAEFKHCRLKNLSRDFFQNTPHLKTFVIKGCNFDYIDPAAYHNVQNLHTLEIAQTGESYNLYDALEHLSSLQNSSLKVLRLINLYRTHCPCRELHAYDAQYLKNIELEELDLSRNRIALVGLDFLNLLPRTLKRLVLCYNKITPRTFNLWKLSFMYSLLELNLDNQIDDPIELHNSDSNNELSVKKPVCFSSRFQSDSSGFQAIEFNRSSLSMILPPNLQKIKASKFTGFAYIILGHDFIGSYSLTEVDFSDSYITDWGNVFVPRLVHKIDMSNNYCHRINPNFFIERSSLKSINLRNNILGETFANDKSGTIFQNLGKLLYLDISMNQIYKLPSRFLQGATNLETLVVSENKLQLLNLTFSHMTRLRFLDFSRNSITWITDKTRNDIDAMAAITEIELDLTFNPLPCTCSGIELMKWLATTRVKLIDQVNLQCQLENGVTLSSVDIKETIEFLQRSCTSKSLILVVSILSAVFVTIVLCLLLKYRYRWKLRYLRNVVMVKFLGFEPKKAQEGKFKYDAYLVYDSDDVQFVLYESVRELEVKRGLKLCILDRDFIPGTHIVGDIVSAVQNSYRTVVLVTPDFYEDDYAEYAVKMAIMEEVYASRKILLLCVYQQVTMDEMPHDLVAIMKRNDFIEYPPEEEITPGLLENFWNQLSAAAKQERLLFYIILKRYGRHFQKEESYYMIS